MSTTELIVKHLQRLPESHRREVLDFVTFLESRNEDQQWGTFSLDAAMRGMEDEETAYSAADFQERFQ